MSYLGYTNYPQCSCAITIEDELKLKLITQCPVCGFCEEIRIIYISESEKMKAQGWDISDCGSDTKLRAIKTFIGIGSIRFAKRNGGSCTYRFVEPITDEGLVQALEDFNDPAFDKTRPD